MLHTIACPPFPGAFSGLRLGTLVRCLRTEEAEVQPTVYSGPVDDPEQEVAFPSPSCGPQAPTRAGPGGGGSSGR